MTGTTRSSAIGTDRPAPLEITVPLGISVEQFSSIMAALSGLYTEVGSSLGIKAVEGLTLSKHRDGSLVLECDPLLAERLDTASVDRVSDTLLKGLEDLAAGTRPDIFTGTALKHARRLADGSPDTTTAVVISVRGRSISCGEEIRSTSQRFVNHRSASWGSVEGYLQMISLRGSAKFSLYELLTDRRIECRFTEDLLDEARMSLGHRVVVSGEIHKRGGDFHYVSVERIHRRPPSEDLPGFADLRGLLADK